MGRKIILPLRVTVEIPETPGTGPIELPPIEFPLPGVPAPTPTSPAPAPGPIAETVKIVDIRGQLPRRLERDPSPATAPKTSLTVHWLGDSGPPFGSDEDMRQYLFQIAFQHLEKDWGGGSRGGGIMYHEAIAPSGTVFLTRNDPDVLWHAGAHEGNLSSRAILVMCSVQVQPNDTQIRVLRRRHRDFGHIWWGGHYVWSPTACPGPRLKEVVLSE